VKAGDFSSSSVTDERQYDLIVTRNNTTQEAVSRPGRTAQWYMAHAHSLDVQR